MERDIVELYLVVLHCVQVEFGFKLGQRDHLDAISQSPQHGYHLAVDVEERQYAYQHIRACLILQCVLRAAASKVVIIEEFGFTVQYTKALILNSENKYVL